MQCIKCGEELPEIAAYCFICGTPQKAVAKRPPTDIAPAEEILRKSDPEGALTSYIEQRNNGNRHIPTRPPDYGAIIVWAHKHYQEKRRWYPGTHVHLWTPDNRPTLSEEVGCRNDQSLGLWNVNGEIHAAAVFTSVYPNTYRVKMGSVSEFVRVEPGTISEVDFTWTTHYP